MSLIRRLIPARVRSALKVLAGRAVVTDLPAEHLSARFSCSVCGGDDLEFQPLPFSYLRQLDENEHIYSIFRYETLNIEHYSCTRCGASDRERLYALYLREVLARASGALTLLDIAPARALQRLLKNYPQVSVRTADLYMAGVDDRIDITDMAVYKDDQFDAFICSHVLEHIDRDVVAMKELHRILRKSGWGIVMVPINLGATEIHEDPAITSEAGRWRYFGQNDHVRMYSKIGFVERLQSVGFTVDQLDRSHFGAAAFAAHGIHPRSVLYVVRK